VEGSTNSLANLSPIVHKALNAGKSLNMAFQVGETCASMRRKAKNVKDLMNMLVIPSQSATQDLNAETLTK